MSDKPKPAAKEDRLAEALRANLRRRKEAARKPPARPDPGPDLEPDRAANTPAGDDATAED